MNNNELILGLDIGGTSCKCGVIDADCNIIYKTNIPSVLSASPDNVLQSIGNLTNDTIAKFPTIAAIGMGVPGVCSDNKIVNSPNFTALLDIDFYDYYTNHYSIPFYMDNDANAAAVAELVKGHGTQYNNLIYITLGTGVGGAIVINRQIFHGTNGGAGELGHTIIDCNSTTNASYRNGTLEEKVGRMGILSLAKQCITKDSLLYGNNYDVREVASAANNNDSDSIKCISEVGYYLGIGIASIATALDIPNFIIGGGISQSDLLIAVATKTAVARAIPSVAKFLTIKRAKFISDTGVIGAALLTENIN
ncbi:MAG: ROK family protein [Ignavibacteria bacterium]|jgi:glucokinase|nr:ROK family protein [Ignavibacteria bacterium]